MLCWISEGEDLMSMQERNLDLAGWLSIANAIIAIPSVALSLFPGPMEGPEGKALHLLFLLVGLGLFLYVITTLKGLLNSRFQFHGVDIYISLLVWGNITLAILDLFSLWSRKIEFLVEILSIFAFVPFGIIAIMFAARLLRLPGDLYGLLKPFSYISIVSGVCYATVILAPLGIIAGAVTDVILGVIFFRAADQPAPPGKIENIPIE